MIRAICKNKLKLLLLVFIPIISFSQEISNGEILYKKRCLGCHGADGNTQAYGISRKLTEIQSAELAEKLKFYTSNSARSAGGVTGVMGKQTARLNKEEYNDVLEYIIENFASNKK